MSVSQKKEKKRYGWPVILIVILILLAIKYGNEKNIGSDPLAGEQEDIINHAVLSAVPEELHGNFFLQQKENGCCNGGYKMTDSRRAGMSPYPSVFHSISQKRDTW